MYVSALELNTKFNEEGTKLFTAFKTNDNTTHKAFHTLRFSRNEYLQPEEIE
jgi:hypothetical protein